MIIFSISNMKNIKHKTNNLVNGITKLLKGLKVNG